MLKCDSPSVSNEPRQLGSVEKLRAALARSQHASATDCVCASLPSHLFYSHLIPFFQKTIDFLQQKINKEKGKTKIERISKSITTFFRKKEKLNNGEKKVSLGHLIYSSRQSSALRVPQQSFILKLTGNHGRKNNINNNSLFLTSLSTHVMIKRAIFSHKRYIKQILEMNDNQNSRTSSIQVMNNLLQENKVSSIII